MEQGITRLERLRLDIERQVDVVAKLICEDRPAFGAAFVLDHLTRELVAEEQRLREESQRLPTNGRIFPSLTRSNPSLNGPNSPTI